ncbi:MAG TPA: hypothetical protein P5158_02900 [Chitinophagaceae bacterium]|nr:hypothetical protein [Chitinophagaceae bacterium]
MLQRFYSLFVAILLMFPGFVFCQQMAENEIVSEAADTNQNKEEIVYLLSKIRNKEVSQNLRINKIVKYREAICIYPVRPEVKFTKRSVVSPSFYPASLGVICRMEWQLEKAIKVPVRFRLGSQGYVDRLEGKKNAAVNLFYYGL